MFGQPRPLRLRTEVIGNSPVARVFDPNEIDSERAKRRTRGPLARLRDKLRQNTDTPAQPEPSVLDTVLGGDVDEPYQPPEPPLTGWD